MAMSMIRVASARRRVRVLITVALNRRALTGPSRPYPIGWRGATALTGRRARAHDGAGFGGREARGGHDTRFDVPARYKAIRRRGAPMATQTTREEPVR